MKTQTRTTGSTTPRGGEDTTIPGHAPAPWQFLKTAASELGLCAVGICPAREVPKQTWSTFQNWIGEGLHADMGYLERWPEPRRDPRHPGIVEGAIAIISVAMPYGNGAARGGLWDHVAAHARGTDYHTTLRQKLEALARIIVVHFPTCSHRAFVDTAPVMERTWAVLCGLGWTGKSGTLIVPGQGPKVLLGELVIANAPSPSSPGSPIRDGCADCSLCVDACPTGALLGNGLVNSEQCLSYQTIENMGARLPESIAKKITLVFGCDECTRICPYIPKEEVTCQLAPPPKHGPASVSLEDISSGGEPWLRDVLGETAMDRTGAEVLARNARAGARKSQGDESEK